MDRNKSIRPVRDIERNTIIREPLRLQSLSKEPVEVISGSEFGTGFPGTTAMIANDAWDINLSEFFYQHADASGNLLSPEENGTEHGVFVGLCQFVVDIPRENVAAEEKDTTRVVQTGEIIVGKKNNLLKELAETLDSDLSVVCVTSLDFIRRDNLIEVGIGKNGTDYASVLGLLLGTKPRGWFDRTGFQIAKKINLLFKCFKFRR